MNIKKIKQDFSQKGFVFIKKIFNKKKINELLKDLENVKAKAVNVWIACSKSSRKNGGLCYYESSNEPGTIKHEISYMKGSSQRIRSLPRTS